MSPSQAKQFVPGTKFEVNGDMARLWLMLRDQRVHERAEVMGGLEAKNREDRLKWFKFMGEFPKPGQVYRYTVHDDGKHLCMEAHIIEEIAV